MRIKALILFLAFFLSLGSFVAYLILNRLIISGSVKVAAGQIQIAEGEKRLANGKARLASGERELASGKKTFSASQNALLAAAVVFPPTLAVAAVAGTGKQVVGSKLVEGDREVAAGRRKVRAGELQLAQGKEELARGISRLNRAKWIRNACGISTALFAALTLILAYVWRRNLFSLFRKSPN